MDKYLSRLIVPSPPTLVLVGFMLLNVGFQAKQISKSKPKVFSNKIEEELAKTNAYSFLLEEIILDVMTVGVASLGINWLYHNWRPVAWFCVLLPLLVMIGVLVLHKKAKKQSAKNHH